jgi:hypothetical protein
MDEPLKLGQLTLFKTPKGIFTNQDSETSHKQARAISYSLCILWPLYGYSDFSNQRERSYPFQHKIIIVQKSSSQLKI